jgi:GAF domain/Sel1 repeat
MPQQAKSILNPVSEQLRNFAEDALRSVGGDGSAIALLTPNGFVCCGSTGNAPPVGSRLNRNSGFSSTCLSAGRLMLCHSANTDSRVDREVCRTQGINSIIAAPILIDDHPAGVLEVFSSRPYAFNEAAGSLIEKLADSIAVSVRNSALVQPFLAAIAEGVSNGKAVPCRIGSETGESRSEMDIGAIDSELREVPQADSSQKAPNSPIVGSNEQMSGPFGTPAWGHDIVDSREDALHPARNWHGLAGCLAALCLVGLVLPISKLYHSPLPGRGIAVQQSSGNGPDAAAKPDLADGAVSHLRKQAESGDTDAEFVLGAKYASGDEVTQDYAEAVKWFSRAVEEGDPFAAGALADFYSAGTGVPQDQVSAYMWREIAEAGGNKSNRYELALLSSRMQPTEVAEARGRATEWLQRHPTFGIGMPRRTAEAR